MSLYKKIPEYALYTVINNVKMASEEFSTIILYAFEINVNMSLSWKKIIDNYLVLRKNTYM